jgi:tetratricopeptide (TPR) repeat protein
VSTVDPAADARFAGLAPATAERLRAAGRHLLGRELDEAETALADVLAEAPEHAEALRLLGVARQLRGRPDEAIELLRRAVAHAPGDALTLNALASALNETGVHDDALVLLRRACEIDPTLASAWLNLGSTLLAHGRVSEAEAALARAVALKPRHAMAHAAHADALASLGRDGEAAAAYRAAIAINDGVVYAWKQLAHLESVTIAPEERESLARVYARCDLSDDDRAVAAFALGKMLERERRYDDAFAAFAQANAIQRRRFPWSASDFSSRVDAIRHAFDAHAARADDATLGSEVIFVVGMPCAGARDVERALAAHPDIEGAGELPDLMAVIQEESSRRGAHFPYWVDAMTATDWQRLGRRYLERTERWRRVKARHVDRGLANWTIAGAALAMLPGARIVNCRRDAIETCWAAYRQLFARGQRIFCYDLGDLAAYWNDYDRLMFFWHARHPGRLYDLGYENRAAEPEREMRALLSFCGVPFDAACVPATKRTSRDERASAQSEAATRDASASNYGALLDPLRRALVG